MRRTLAAAALSVTAVSVTLSGCSNGSGSNGVVSEVSSAATTAKSCAKVIAKVAQIDYGRHTNATQLQNHVDDLQSTVNGLSDQTVKKQSDALLKATRNFVQALPNDTQRQKALDQVKSSAKKVGSTCHVPVNQLIKVSS